jgi:hypothetical protein
MVITLITVFSNMTVPSKIFIVALATVIIFLLGLTDETTSQMKIELLPKAD